ncbi:MAG: efflux RND transporter periplasmic adaptor subunit, partial [Pseudomonadales bacterium]
MHIEYGVYFMHRSKSIVIVMVCGALSACSAPSGDGQAVAPIEKLVQVAEPVAASSSLPVAAMGRLERDEESTLGFLAGGVVDRILVDIGDRVSKGQVLASQAPTALDAALAQAREQEIQARRDRDRAAGLLAKQLVARQVLDDADTRLQLAEAARRSAVFAADNARIVAPADGVVLRRLAEPGEVVGAGAPVLAISGGRGGWRMHTIVADRDGIRLRVNDRATVRIDALGGAEWPARVDRVGGEADLASGGIAIELVLELPPSNEIERLRSGLVASARIDSSQDSGLAIPTAALVAVDQGRGQIF